MSFNEYLKDMVGKTIRGVVTKRGDSKRGEARPVAAVMNLFRLLDRHPELLKELKKQKAALGSDGLSAFLIK